MSSEKLMIFSIILMVCSIGAVVYALFAYRKWYKEQQKKDKNPSPGTSLEVIFGAGLGGMGILLSVVFFLCGLIIGIGDKIDRLGDRLENGIDKLENRMDRLGDRLEGKIGGETEKILKEIRESRDVILKKLR